MEFILKHYGYRDRGASQIIELIVEDFGNKLVSDVTDLNGKVDENLIESLKNIVSQLEEQNKNLDIKLKEN